jgi:hypothetical protein
MYLKLIWRSMLKTVEERWKANSARLNVVLPYRSLKKMAEKLNVGFVERLDCKSQPYVWRLPKC